MAGLKQRVSARVDAFRAAHPKADHVLRMLSHYGQVDGNAQAGAVTFFGFLSFFPLLALAFFAVGQLAGVSADFRDELVRALEEALPGLVGEGDGQISLSTFEDYAGTVGLVGLAGVLYSGLGWLSGLRNALEVMFVLPRAEQPNLVLGKLRDLLSLAVLGVVLVVSVSLSGLVSGFSEAVLEWLGFDPRALVPFLLLWLLVHGLAIAASTVLLLTMFRLLVDPPLPRRAMLEGALLGAVGFEVLKALASYLVAQTRGQPAFQAFGVALILLVWINYFSRLVMYAAAYAYTAPVARTSRSAEAVEAAAPEPGIEPLPVPVGVGPPSGAGGPGRPGRLRRSVAVVASSLLALLGVAVAVVVRRRQGA